MMLGGKPGLKQAVTAVSLTIVTGESIFFVGKKVYK